MANPYFTQGQSSGMNTRDHTKKFPDASEHACDSIAVHHAKVVQRVDNFIHWIVCYPADKMCARFL